MIKLGIYSILASLISTSGLLSNSMPAIIASMIVSPLLQPIIDYLFKGKGNQINAISTTILLILLVILVGFIMGIINNKYKFFYNETEAMQNIVQYNFSHKNSKLITETIIALSVGIGLPYAVIMGDATLLVAFAIAPSITPPLSNVGLYLSNYFNGYNKLDLENSYRSLFLGMLHVIVIIMLGYIYLLFFKNKKIKNKK